MVEWDGLENRYTLTGIVSSNLTSSVVFIIIYRGFESSTFRFDREKLLDRALYEFVCPPLAGTSPPLPVRPA